MKLKWLALILLATSFAVGQQIPCTKFDEQPDTKIPQYTMRGCRSFNELEAAGGIKIDKGKEIKSYACFATTLPEEAQDFFIFAVLGGIMTYPDDKEQNGMASLQTFSGGVKLNSGFTPLKWTQYPKENPFLWSEGTWLGHGDAQMMGWSDEAKALVPQPESDWKRMHLPRLHASVDSDTVIFRLDINNDKGNVESLRFNRRTGRALLELDDNSHALRCVPIEGQN
jgi:hypothetical protein